MIPGPAIQIDLFVDTLPAFLGPVLVFFGLELVLAGSFRGVLDDLGVLPRLSGGEQFLGIGGIAVGLLFAVSGVLRLFNLLGVYVVLLFCLGRLIEGAGAVRFYRTVLDFLRGHGTGAGLGGKMKHGLILLFVTFLAVWLGFRVLERGPFYGTTLESLRLIWTGFVVLTVGIGINRKLRHASDQLVRGQRIGLVLCVVGAEVYNFTSLSLELATYVAGSVAFSAGFWLAAFFLLLRP